jgi:hypothetical protein
MAGERDRQKTVALAALVACMAVPCALFAQRFPRVCVGLDRADARGSDCRRRAVCKVEEEQP